MLFDRAADAVCDDEEEREVHSAGDTGAVGDVEGGEVGEEAFQRARGAGLLREREVGGGGHVVVLLPNAGGRGMRGIDWV